MAGALSLRKITSYGRKVQRKREIVYIMNGSKVMIYGSKVIWKFGQLLALRSLGYRLPGE